MDIVFLYKCHQIFEAIDLPFRHVPYATGPVRPPPRRKQLALAATAVTGGMLCIDFALSAAPRAHVNDTAIICLYIACVISAASCAASRFHNYFDHAAAAPRVKLSNIILFMAVNTVITAVLISAILLLPHLRPQHFIVHRPEHFALCVFDQVNRLEWQKFGKGPTNNCWKCGARLLAISRQ